MLSMNPAGEDTGFRSRAVAAVLAMLAGTFGAHHYYLGRRFWWIYPLVAMPLLGIALQFDEWYRQWPFFVAAGVTLVSLGEAIRIALISDEAWDARDRKSTRLNSSHVKNSYAVFCWYNKTMMYYES